MDEVAELEEVRCARGGCGHGYREHDAGGGPCRHAVGGFTSPANAIPCPCWGFRWIAGGDTWIGPHGPTVTYSGTPEPSYSPAPAPAPAT